MSKNNTTSRRDFFKLAALAGAASVPEPANVRTGGQAQEGHLRHALE